MSAPAATRVRARYRPHPRGFGFATPVAADTRTPTTAGVVGAAGATTTVERIFVPPALARSLIADDLVDVDVALGDKGPAAEGVEVVARPRRLLVGLVARRRGGGLVIELDRALGTAPLGLDAAVAGVDDVGQQVVVLAGAGDDGAPAAQAVVAGPAPPGHPDAVRARAVTLVLGGAAPSLSPPGPAEVGLDPAAAETTHVRVMGQLAGGRRGAAAGLDRSGAVPGAALASADRRDEACVTVDAGSSRELDDALAARWDGAADGPVDVAVHITDVAAEVGVGSAADRYARTVAATAYLASADSAPMLDPALSEQSHSLVAGQDRRVLSVRFAVRPDGGVDEATVEPALIRSRARLTYAAADRWLGGDPRPLRTQAGSHADAAADVVSGAVEAARRLGVARDARATLDELFDTAELVPTVAGGRMSVGLAEPHAEAYRLIERLMVAANEAVGRWLAARASPALYRAHEGIAVPQHERLRAAVDRAGATVGALDADEPEPEQVAAELLAEVDRLAAAGDTAAHDLLTAVATSSMARATYDPEPAHHRGLAASAYCHFTSPLRRYADLVVHRQVRAALADEPPPHDTAELAALAPWLGARGGALGRLEARERADLWAWLLERGELAGAETATVTGLTGAGLRIRLPRLGLTGFVRAEDLPGVGDGGRATLSVDEHGLSTADGAWQVGARLEVRFAGLDDAGRASWRAA